jgi:hypothetical protein
MPTTQTGSFFITLCFFCNEVDTYPMLYLNLAKWLERFDPDLLQLIRKAKKDFEKCHLSIFTGDPEEELEEALEAVTDRLPHWTGYLNINRSFRLRQDDPLPEDNEDYDPLVGELAPTERIRDLLKYIEKKYFYYGELLKTT